MRVAVAGGREAFETLVRRHRRSLVSHLYRQIGRRDAALDLAQEVFLKVYLSLGSFDPRYRFTTWLYRIATNCAIDLLRRKQPHTCPLQADVQGAEGEAPEREWVGAEPTPHEMLRLRELQERLEVAVSRLPAGYRRLILLRHRQHCRYDEIARITQLPIGTVKNRIFRARELLRRDLAEVLDAEV
ncbi:MAG TPA: sigma-70 family RNA polymerase sigma factor [Candidatus Polarisedimenticolaceae bacterium]|nr:sigma-70 family RNA polymerase sigma factor [Candidatus Polarisedimenticolaceae bacterium]